MVVGCLENDNADLDEGGESELMPGVAIIKILSEQCGAAPPKPEVIEDWRSRYLEIHDDQIDGLDPDPDYKVERRKVIDETFTGLIQLATKFWKRERREVSPWNATRRTTFASDKIEYGKGVSTGLALLLCLDAERVYTPIRQSKNSSNQFPDPSPCRKMELEGTG